MPPNMQHHPNDLLCFLVVYADSLGLVFSPASQTQAHTHFLTTLQTLLFAISVFGIQTLHF